ncbi:NUDIX domain-containing protein [Acinetobacter guerrae]|uniref:ADP-ribose pyrophosphatase n=1 Tax=Acinetobacter guerrae TaxID=1843371 RepID=A0A3A8EGB8_9GAMM|nr:NUDIX domain-containing protein [Acinetobacter guerrae]RKG32546.1 NUDIX domain-containing protein [Acinetobacter guerrae]
MDIVEHATFSHNDVKIHSREYVFRGFVKIEKISLQHRMFNQNNYIQEIQRELIQRKTAAGVLLYNDAQQKFALIEQFRVGAVDDSDSPWQLEIIAGVLDGDESPETCIRRESLEESGCQIDELEHLFSFYPSAGACSEVFHLYAAQTDLPEHGGVHGVADEGENIQLHIFDYTQLEPLFRYGRLKNAPVIMALQWLHQKIKMTKTAEG